MAGDLVEFYDDTFDVSVLSSASPVLVDFWAPWCGPCKAMDPTLAEVASEQKSKWVVGKVNIQDNPKTAGRFGIRSIPVLLFFIDGQCRGTLTGTQSKQKITETMKSLAG